MRALIVGCGYIGTRLVEELIAQEHEVVGIRASPAGKALLETPGVQIVSSDLTSPDFVRPAGNFDVVVFTAISRPGAPLDERRALMVDGLRRFIAQFADQPPRRFILASCAEVYGQEDGSIVKETSLTQPRTATAEVLMEAERVLANTGSVRLHSVILRIADIYGPDRHPMMDRYIRNEYRIAGNGLRYFNMVHREDVVGAILAAVKNGRPGETYNVVDQEPVMELQFFTWLSETLGKWMPPFSAEGASPEERLAQTHRRVSNRRLTMELGYHFKYPNFRHGYTAEIKRLTDLGLLNVDPEPR